MNPQSEEEIVNQFRKLTRIHFQNCSMLIIHFSHIESERKSKAMILKLRMASLITKRISLEPLKLEQNYVPVRRYKLKFDNLFRFKMFLKVTKDN